MSTPFEIIIKENPAGLCRAGADILFNEIKSSIKRQNAFTLAVSGGSTPRVMHRLLAKEPYRGAVPWEKTHLFWVDDRCVPLSDKASNYGAALKDFLEKTPMPPDRIHPMPTAISPSEGADRYQKDLKTFFHPGGKGFPVFDLVFLGIGTDGHTASLFPGHKALDEKEKWAIAVKGGKPNVNRLTLTFPVLNSAKKIVFLVSGKGKAEILGRLLGGKGTSLPAQRIKPAEGKLIWLVDRDAASMLPEDIIDAAISQN